MPLFKRAFCFCLLRNIKNALSTSIISLFRLSVSITSELALKFTRGKAKIAQGEVRVSEQGKKDPPESKVLTKQAQKGNAGRTQLFYFF